MEEQFCEICGQRLNRYNKRYCYVCQEKMREGLIGNLGSEAKLREFAHFYGFALAEEASLRRFCQHAKGVNQPRVLGITYRDGEFGFHCQPGQMIGPVSDLGETFLLPPGTFMVQPSVCSGSVSGCFYQGVLASGLKHPNVVLRAEAGCSGINIRLLPYPPLKAKPISDTIL